VAVSASPPGCRGCRFGRILPFGRPPRRHLLWLTTASPALRRPSPRRVAGSGLGAVRPLLPDPSAAAPHTAGPDMTPAGRPPPLIGRWRRGVRQVGRGASREVRSPSALAGTRPAGAGMPVPHRIPLRRSRPPRVPATRLCTVRCTPSGHPRSCGRAVRPCGFPVTHSRGSCAGRFFESAFRYPRGVVLRVPGRAMTRCAPASGAAVSWPDGARGVLLWPLRRVIPADGWPGRRPPVPGPRAVSDPPGPDRFRRGVGRPDGVLPERSDSRAVDQKGRSTKGVRRGSWASAPACGPRTPTAHARRRPILPWGSGPLSGLRTLTRGGKVATVPARRPPGPASGSPSAHGFGSVLRATTR